MLPSQIEISVRMDGSEILGMQQLSRIITLLYHRGLFVPSILILTFVGQPITHTIWQINLDSWAKPTNDWLM
jgi:hypothetical protein